MCFSAQASFIVSGVLTLTGIASYYLAHKKTLKVFALTPLIFALQQAAEGAMWLSGGASGILAINALYIFLFTACVWWPVWIPSIMFFLEHDLNRKKAILGCLITGIVVGCAALYNLIVYGASFDLMHHHIAYLTHPMPAVLNYLYFIAVVTPLLLVRNKSMWVLAAGISAAYVISAQWFPLHIGSVWCFFAAIVSSCTLIIVWYNRGRRI